MLLRTRRLCAKVPTVVIADDPSGLAYLLDGVEQVIDEFLRRLDEPRTGGVGLLKLDEVPHLVVDVDAADRRQLGREVLGQRVLVIERVLRRRLKVADPGDELAGDPSEAAGRRQPEGRVVGDARALEQRQ